MMFFGVKKYFPQQTHRDILIQQASIPTTPPLNPTTNPTTQFLKNEYCIERRRTLLEKVSLLLLRFSYFLNFYELS